VKIRFNVPINSRKSRRTFAAKKYANAKPWVIKAIAQEEKRPSDQMWQDEPSAEAISEDQLSRIRFFRKHGKVDPELLLIANCLDQCESRNRCCSGACPECSRLFQRFYVRQTRKPIQNIIEPEGKKLIAICLITSSSIVRHGQLKHFSISNFQRRFKTALGAANIQSGIGGVDFSFNEDREKKWQPFICPHIYFITATDNKRALRRMLQSIYKPNAAILEPIELPIFDNTAWRRSYSLKMKFKRRISYYKMRKENQKKRSRNSSYDKLRTSERIELFKYLHHIGFAARVIFKGIKPEISNSKVRFRKA
jgi:hypothetical protein